MKRFFVAFGLLALCLLPTWGQERFRKFPPFPEPLQALALPRIESVRLSNELTVAVGYKRGLPFINLQLVIWSGESSSPQGLPGVATFTAEMLSRGTARESAADLEERIEAIGGIFSITTSHDYTLFTFSFLDEYLDEALEILGLMVLQPAFFEREIATMKRILFYDFLEKYKDIEFVGQRHLLRMLFRDHPYRNALADEDVLRNINREDIQSFYNQHYRPNNAIFVLVGNLNLSVASRKVSHFFNTWRSSPLEKASLPSLRPNDTPKIHLVDFPKSRDAMIFLGNIIFPVGDPDYFPFSVLNQVLGGTPHSRLFMNLRESREYAYFAFSDFELYRSGGIFWVRAMVIPQACATSIQEILREIEKMAREKISTFEIEQAKSYLIGNFPLQIEGLEAFSFKLAEIMTYSLGDDYWSRFYENIMLVDSERVFEVAQKYLLPQPVIVVVGDKNLLFDYLQEYERIDVYDIKGDFLFSQTKESKE